MAIYATLGDLVGYAVGDPDRDLVPTEEDEAEGLLTRAEIAVDLVVGGDPDPSWLLLATPVTDPPRKLNPAALSPVQRTALTRATCAAALHELRVGRDVLEGAGDYMGDNVRVVAAAAARSPQVVAELANHGLIRRSGTLAAPPPEASTR
jgi:hypothetical protein